MPKLSREEVEVTSILKNILDNYPAGSATLREILQNTDDAGAQTQTFILDTRHFESNGLVDPVLGVCQGPAIIATNNAYFQPKDWTAIRQISNSSKTQDETSTGKYGLGFRSCYHITDNPHILSHDKLLILDPHKRVEDYPGGLELSTTRPPEDPHNDRNTYPGHFAPFAAILKDSDHVYQGTAIRLPLRLPGSGSKIKSTPTSIETARQMFRDFIAKELPESMLFLKHITTIELKEIDDSGDEMLLATARIENADAIALQRSRNRGREEESSHYELTTTVRVGSDPVSTRHWIIANFVEKYQTASGHMSRRLGRPQSEVKADMSTDKLLPHVALALPVPEDGAVTIPEFHGRLFTLLPLPIITGFPLHINAVLALTSSRQNLRNAQDVVAGTREEFLVEWNRVIFSEFVPKAWASLMEYIVANMPRTLDVFAAWPTSVATQDGDPGYWFPLPARLLGEAAERSVWPLRSEMPPFSSLRDVIVALEGETTAPLAPLESCGVPLVIAPQRVVALIRNSTYATQILSPGSAQPYIRKNSNALNNLDTATIKAICDYLASANDLNLLLNLAIIPNVQGGHTSIYTHSTYTMANSSEASVFGTVDRELLAADCMSASTRQILLNGSAGRIHPIGPGDVARYLQKHIGTFGGIKLAVVTNGVAATTVEWLVKFWGWLDGWDKFNALVNDSAAWGSIQRVHALPLRNDRPALRLVERSAIRPNGTDPEVIAGLASLEVPVLHDSLSNGPAVQRVSKPSSDVVFILQNVSRNKSFSTLDQDTRKTLHEFFTAQLSNYLRPGSWRQPQISLDSECRKALRTLPIFPTFNPGLRNNNSISFDIAPSGTWFVDESVQVIPNIRDTAFVNHSHGRTLCSALGENNVEGEISVLRKAISQEAWSQQDQVTGLLAALVDRLIRRLNEFDRATLDRIGELPIVDVGGRARRLSPKKVVDPTSALAGLFDPEDEFLPVGEFAREGAGTYIHQLRSYGMLRNALTPPTIEERVTKIADPTKPMKDKEGKALSLLRLLDSYTRPRGTELSSSVTATLRNSSWIPIGGTFYRPSECWDSRSAEAFLCDMVFPRITFTIGSAHLRSCLDWTRLSFEVLKKQLLAVLNADPNRSPTSRMDDSDRVEAVLKEFATGFKAGRFSEEQIGLLVEELGDADWVPTSRGNRVQARRSTLEPLFLGTKFFPVSSALLQASGMQELLLQMGISKRPSLAALYSNLQEISNELSEPTITHHERDAGIRTAISILEETIRSRDSPEFDIQQLLIPTESSVLALAPTVLLNDMGDTPPTPQPGLFFAHPSVSSALAYTLGLRKISEEEFARDEDDIDAFHMAEDLTARIQGVLTEYAIDHSSNEWIANADDAKARSFTFLVDEAKFEGKRVLGGLTDFQSGPALVIHNDGVFSEKDFQGLGNIGRGGKGGDMDSIGRFGLGALSFYHFTELPLVVSSRYLLLLDPSQRYLPRSRAGMKRTGIRVSLSICAMRYPDQLKPLEELFGFRAADGFYNGTIFRFPLRTASQAAESRLSKSSFSAVGVSEVVNRFYAYASQSLFFTKSVRSISAMRRDPDLSLRPIWSVTASQETIQNGLENSMLASCLELQLTTPNSGRTTTEHWLVTQTRMDQAEFPPTFQQLFSRYRLPSPSFGIAMNLSASDVPKDSRLFATLPLPVSISLPIHIHATWILAQDRRSIRCDAPDAGGHRTMDSQYNEYLLANVIPGLYLRSLAVIVNRYPKMIRHFWPRKSQDGLSRTVGSAFYKQLISSTEPVLLTVENKPIAPIDAIVHLYHMSPAPVRKVLTELKIPNYVATPHFDTGFLDDWGSLRRDSPTEVAMLLREYVTDLQRLWRSAPQPSSKFNADDVLSMLDYLMKEEEPLTGVPLLLRGDGELAVFRGSDHRSVFASHRGDISELFGRSAVVSPIVTELAAQKLSKAGVNVRMLDAEGMRELLRNHQDPVTPEPQRSTNETQREWHRKLLDFLARPTSPVKMEDLANLPLLPTVGGDLAISLDYANDDSVWWRSMTEHLSLTTVILQLGVVSVDVLPGTLSKTESTKLPQILKLFARFEHDLQRLHEQVNLEDWDPFVRYLKAWIQPNILSQLSNADFTTLINIPLFEGRRSVTHIPFVSSSQVLMMPSGVSFDDVARYLPNDAIFATPSLELTAILRRGSDHPRILSFDGLLHRLQIPEQLPEGTDAEFTTLLRLITTNHSGAYHGRLVPDTNRVVRRPDRMFDHREELFSTAFENRPELFIHPAFRSLTDNLLSLGLQREVTSQRLLESIQAVDTDVRSGLETGRRARWVWNYVNDAPQPIRGISWGQIRSLRFIPRDNQRHPSDSNLDRYARDLPAIVSLDELCIPERASLVWTQRASFVSTPTTILKAVYSEIGEPTPPDVVRHLVELATEVGPALAQSPLLFSEVRGVYDWLQSNKDNVSELLRLLSGQPLWLNVESDQDTWTWRSADELVFDLQYDGGQHFDVRNFLTRYRTLLVDVGAREYRYAELPSAPPSTENLPHPEKVRSGWNRLRQNGRLFDICFRVEGQKIPAHRGMLAAVVPHFMTAFAGEFQEADVSMIGGELPEYPLPPQAGTSAFAINSVVEYVYSGKFTPPTCSTSEEATTVLENLLNLLELSNIWDMPELKGQAVKAIVELRLVRVETCDPVLERAVACQAEDLAQVCRETKSQNQWT